VVPSSPLDGYRPKGGAKARALRQCGGDQHAAVGDPFINLYGEQRARLTLPGLGELARA
jgi:hypothetical protein